MIRCRFKSASTNSGYRVHAATRRSYGRWETLCYRPVSDETVDWLHEWNGDLQKVNCQRCIKGLKREAEHIMALLRGTS